MQRSLPLHGQIPADAPPPGLALARKGFRPFFLAAALFAAGIVPAWLLVLFAGLKTKGDPVMWHAHEMLFGFVTAVIAGFLLTAVGNWTGRETVVGGKLLALVCVWAVGRFVPAVDLAFLPLLMIAIGRPLWAAQSRRNFVMLGVLAALFAANVAIHLGVRHALHVALDIVIFLCVVIAGRIVPMFTRNATGASEISSSPALDIAAAATMGAVTLADAIAPESRIAVGAAAVAGLVTLVRLAKWWTARVLQHPLLWILHAGVAWIGVGLLLRPFGTSLAAHALTVGAIGSLTLGMMARVSLGHTGRPLAPPKAMTFAFAFLQLATVIRLGHGLIASGVLWTAAFALYAITYAPILLAPRLDGKPG